MPSIATRSNLAARVRRALRVAAQLAAIAAAHYAVYAYVMYSNQLQMIFPGGFGVHHPFSAKLPPNARLVQLPASFGALRAIYLAAPATSGRAPAILFTHGNFDRAQDFVPRFRALAARGAAVLLLEYPGYDGSDGAPDFQALSEATQVAYDWLAAQPGVDAGRIIGFGYSVGGGVIANVSRTRKLAALVLISTYTSLADMAHRYLLPERLLRVPFDNVARLRSFDGPTLVIHGRRDGVIPFAAGEALTRAARQAHLIELDCGHADCNVADDVFYRTVPEWLTAKGLLANEG